MKKYLIVFLCLFIIFILNIPVNYGLDGKYMYKDNNNLFYFTIKNNKYTFNGEIESVPKEGIIKLNESQNDFYYITDDINGPYIYIEKSQLNLYSGPHISFYYKFIKIVE